MSTEDDNTKRRRDLRLAVQTFANSGDNRRWLYAVVGIDPDTNHMEMAGCRDPQQLVAAVYNLINGILMTVPDPLERQQLAESMKQDIDKLVTGSVGGSGIGKPE